MAGVSVAVADVLLATLFILSFGWTGQCWWWFLAGFLCAGLQGSLTQLMAIAHYGSSSLCEDLVGSILMLCNDFPGNQVLFSLFSTRTGLPTRSGGRGRVVLIGLSFLMVTQLLQMLAVVLLGQSGWCGLEGLLVLAFQTSALQGWAELHQAVWP